MKTTLEAAEEFGTFTPKQCKRFLEEHGITWSEASKELGDSVLDAVTLCLWLGY